MTQLNVYNFDEAYSQYTKPTIDLYYMNKYWAFLTKGMQPAELHDFEQAKKQLEHYEKIFGIVEYVSELNEHLTVLERRIQTNNPTMPQNMWRKCSGNAPDKLWPEIE
jgi:hypothetical protein